MNGQQFLNLRKQLKPDESLVLHASGKIQQIWHNKDGKKCYRYIGNLDESIPETIIPLLNKPFATPKLRPHLVSDFGKPLPKYDKNDEEIQKKIKVWTMLFDGFKALGKIPKKGIWTDTLLRLNYDTEELNGIKVYYFRENPRYIEFEGEKLAIPQLKPELKTEIFDCLADVK